MSKNIGCRIVTGYKRPSAALVKRFENLPVANIDDCMNRLAAVHQDIRPMNKAKLLGTAFTVKVPQGDNLMIHYALELAEPGDVLVIDGEGDLSHSLLGEIMVTYARQKKIAGVVVNGCIRDSDALSKLTDFSVYAMGVTPQGPYKNGPGEINVPVCCGGVAVLPGDLLAGDQDGIVVIRRDDAPGLIEGARKKFASEEEMLRTGVIKRDWVRKAFENIPVY